MYESWTALGNYILVEQQEALPVNEWLLFRTPIDEFFRADQKTDFSIEIHNFTRKPIPEFYLDDIRLVAAGP